MLQLLSELCSSLETPSDKVVVRSSFKKNKPLDSLNKTDSKGVMVNSDYTFVNLYGETNLYTNKYLFQIIEPFDRMEKFWEKFNGTKSDNILMRKERNELLLENKQLRHSLRMYLVTVARMQTARPHTAF